MRDDVARAIKISGDKFEMAWPIVSPYIGGGIIRSIEAEQRNSVFAQELDTECGCDYVQTFVFDGTTHKRFLGVRVQNSKDQYHYQTVTFRLATAVSGALNTEVEKRLRQIEAGSIYPSHTVHLYFVGADLVGGYIVDTKQILLLAKALLDGKILAEFQHDRGRGWGTDINTKDQNVFCYVSSNVMDLAGIEYHYVKSERQLALV